eukprot:6440370-Lingulodinium_polyedra.AAC.1
MLRVCRQAAALALAAGSQFLWRWVPSEWNAADPPSRGLPGAVAAAARGPDGVGAAAGLEAAGTARPVSSEPAEPGQ